MMRTLLLSDLDNTLLYSRKHARPGDVCVEWINGETQGFMPPQAVELLGRMPGHLRLVPVTSRSIEQYRRIRWPHAEPETAVCANGGVLMQNGRTDARWQDDADALVKQNMPALHAVAHELGHKDDFLRLRMVDDCYLFALCSDHESAVSAMNGVDVPKGVVPWLSGRKWYFMPEGLDKGWAAERLKKMPECDILLAAGDSEMDVPMLQRADVALVPDAGMAQMLAGVRTEICPKDVPFPVFVLNYAREISEKGE